MGTFGPKSLGETLQDIEDNFQPANSKVKYKHVNYHLRVSDVKFSKVLTDYTSLNPATMTKEDLYNNKTNTSPYQNEAAAAYRLRVLMQALNLENDGKLFDGGRNLNDLNDAMVKHREDKTYTAAMVNNPHEVDAAKKVLQSQLKNAKFNLRDVSPSDMSIEEYKKYFEGEYKKIDDAVEQELGNISNPGEKALIKERLMADAEAGLYKLHGQRLQVERDIINREFKEDRQVERKNRAIRTRMQTLQYYTSWGSSTDTQYIAAGKSENYKIHITPVLGEGMISDAATKGVKYKVIYDNPTPPDEAKPVTMRVNSNSTEKQATALTHGLWTQFMGTKNLKTDFDLSTGNSNASIKAGIRLTALSGGEPGATNSSNVVASMVLKNIQGKPLDQHESELQNNIAARGVNHGDWTELHHIEEALEKELIICAGINGAPVSVAVNSDKIVDRITAKGQSLQQFQKDAVKQLTDWCENPTGPRPDQVTGPDGKLTPEAKKLAAICEKSLRMTPTAIIEGHQAKLENKKQAEAKAKATAAAQLTTATPDQKAIDADAAAKATTTKPKSH